MDGRTPTGILYVNTHVSDPAVEIEFDHWYRDVHFHDVTEPGVFVNATMFHNANAPLPVGEGKFLALYETYWKDLSAATQALREHVGVLVQEDRIHAKTVAKSFGAYEQLAICFSSDRRKRAQSLVAVHVDCGDDSKLDELREWYTAKHVPEVVDLGVFHTGSFNELLPGSEAIAERSSQARFIALYESDIGNPRYLGSQLFDAFPNAKALPDFVEFRFASMFYRVSP